MIPDAQVFRHRKGGVYTLIGQVGPVVYYVSHEDGKRWWRPASEFFDGRFDPTTDVEPISPFAAGFSRG